MIPIRQLTEPHEATIWRRLSLAAIRQHPDAFVTTYAEEASIPLAQFEKEITTRNVLVTDDEAGLAVLTVDGTVGHVSSVYVQTDRRGRGYGEALMHELHTVALSKGCEKLQLYVFGDNTHAVDLYQRHHFTLVASEPYGDREDWLMTCQLPR